MNSFVSVKVDTEHLTIQNNSVPQVLTRQIQKYFIQSPHA